MSERAEETVPPTGSSTTDGTEKAGGNGDEFVCQDNNDSRNHDNNNQVTNYSNTLSCRSCNILLIGLSYNSFVLNQLMNDSNIGNISECKDVSGRIIDQCVARDTYRCYVLEKTYDNVKVYTVNKCTDAVRTCDNDNDPFNINCDVGTNQFLKLVNKKSWTFSEIYVDTIRMQKIYVQHNFSRNFFNNLATLKSLNIIVGKDGEPGIIYLPFNPHFFHMVHTNMNIAKTYSISYLKENDIRYENHKLSNSISCHDDFNSVKKSIKEENRYNHNKKRDS